jgi:hypothetical protein
MIKLIVLTSVSALVLAGCTTPQPLCDRGAIAWDKWGETTIPAECQDTPSIDLTPTVERDNDNDVPEQPTDKPTGVDPTGPEQPNTPTQPETPDSPATTPDRVRGDNSDANGKGGNRHDRDDFTHGGTEVAEDRKEAQ